MHLPGSLCVINPVCGKKKFHKENSVAMSSMPIGMSSLYRQIISHCQTRLETPYIVVWSLLYSHVPQQINISCIKLDPITKLAPHYILLYLIMMDLLLRSLLLQTFQCGFLEVCHDFTQTKQSFHAQCPTLEIQLIELQCLKSQIAYTVADTKSATVRQRIA